MVPETSSDLSAAVSSLPPCASMGSGEGTDPDATPMPPHHFADLRMPMNLRTLITSQPATPASNPAFAPVASDSTAPAQDFVLFDSSHRIAPRRPSLVTAAAIEASRRASHISAVSPSSQPERRVSTFQPSTGHTSGLDASYASRIPSYLQRPRPQVPLFADSNQARTMQDMHLFDEGFTAFEGGAPRYDAAYASPAVPTIYDTTTMSTSAAPSMGTVSPQDLFTPAPNSAAMTNLTSPSDYNESPQYDQLEMSPFVRNDMAPSAPAEPWYPLFPQDDQKMDAQDEREVADALRTRARASSNASPPNKHASISGVAARKRDKPLPPIIVDDPNDTVAMKRARNTLAARKSRQRKTQKFEELEATIDHLTKDRDYWKQLALQREGQA